MKNKILVTIMILGLNFNLIAKSKDFGYDNDYKWKNDKHNNLNLTEFQKNRIEEINKRYDRRLDDLKKDKLTGKERKEKIDSIREKREIELRLILTEKQEDKLLTGNGKINPGLKGNKK